MAIIFVTALFQKLLSKITIISIIFFDTIVILNRINIMFFFFFNFGVPTAPPPVYLDNFRGEISFKSGFINRTFGIQLLILQSCCLK